MSWARDIRLASAVTVPAAKANVETVDFLKTNFFPSLLKLV